jgi:hypothetical protein
MWTVYIFQKAQGMFLLFIKMFVDLDDEQEFPFNFAVLYNVTIRSQRLNFQKKLSRRTTALHITFMHIKAIQKYMHEFFSCKFNVK